LIDEGVAFNTPEYFVETTNGMYFSNISFIRKLIVRITDHKLSMTIYPLLCLSWPGMAV
jgi:hypothetical protein